MKKLITVLAALTLVFGVVGIAAAATGGDVGACLTCETDPGNIDRGCEGIQNTCYPFDYEDYGECADPEFPAPPSYCSEAKGEIHRALFKICDCINEGVWTGLVAGETVDVSMEILVDSGSGMESGDNGVYWAQDVNSTGSNGIAMQTYPTQADACEDTDCTPDDAFVGRFIYQCADGTEGWPLLGPDSGCDDIGDCDNTSKVKRNRVVKIIPDPTQTDQDVHGYTVTTDDDIDNNSVWRIDIPYMRVDPDVVSKGDKVYVKICLLKTLSGGGVCGECEGCCCTVYIGEICCPDTCDMDLIYPYATSMTDPNWWFGMTITNIGGSSGTATITMYENDGDISTGTVTVSAHSNLVLSAADLAAALTMTTSVEGTMGNSVYYVEVTTDFPAMGFAMIANNGTGESMGYLPLPGWRSCD